MKFKKTRIAFSVLWGILCLSLIALWIRSCWRADFFIVVSPKDNWELSVGSAVERILFHYDRVDLNSEGGVYCLTRCESVDNWDSMRFNIERGFWEAGSGSFHYPFWGFGIGPNGNGYEILLPHWFAVILVLSVAIAPWIRWRFSLRTLLIATTAVAVSLWFIVWMARR